MHQQYPPAENIGKQGEKACLSNMSPDILMLIGENLLLALGIDQGNGLSNFLLASPAFKGVPKAFHLQALDFGNNLITDAGAKDLARAIALKKSQGINLDITGIQGIDLLVEEQPQGLQIVTALQEASAFRGGVAKD